MSEPPRLRLFNVKFSPNLGDGLLSECLEKALIEFGANPEATYSVDLAGRTSYKQGSTRRGKILSILAVLPPSVRSAILRPVLATQKRFRWSPHYAENLHDCNAVVIGGGNLFTDMDLNFPTKICEVLRQANTLKLPVAIYGVGVGRNWSKAGQRMMTTALAEADVRYVSVRDVASKANFLNLFDEALQTDVKIVRDPGLLISRYVPAKEPEAQRKSVGICLTSAIAVRYHSEIDISERALLHWYRALFEELLARKLEVRFFTNGSPEDIAFAESFAKYLNGLPPIAVEQPTTPTELAQIVSSCSAIAGFRMHALIAGASYGRELIALEWDPKLNAFMQSIGAGDQIYRVPDTSPAVVATRVNELLFVSSGNSNTGVIEEAILSVNTVLSSLRG